MKGMTLSGWSITFGLLFLVMSCSSPANENRGNRPAQNAVKESPTPASPTPTPESPEAEVTRLIGDLASALTKNDADALDRILSDGFILITETGQVSPKPELITMVKSGDLKFEKVSFEEVSVRGYESSAVALSHAFSDRTTKGKRLSTESRMTFVAVKENGTWRFVSAQATPVVPEPRSGGTQTSSGVGNMPPTNSTGNSKAAPAGNK